ncbi:response regulator [Streptomyces sp. NPDC001212]
MHGRSIWSLHVITASSNSHERVTSGLPATPAASDRIVGSPSARTVVRLALRRQGYDLFAAGADEEGPQQLRPFHPGVVIFDLMLPGMSGLDVCRRMRGHDQVPITMVTAKGKRST